MDPRKEKLTDEQSLDFMADVLSKESLRLIDKCLIEAKHSLEIYKEAGGVEKKVRIRSADILALSFLKFKHENLIDFFVQEIDFFINYDLLRGFMEERDFIQKIPKEELFKLIRYISHKLRKDNLELEDPEIIEKIFAMSFSFAYNEVYLGHPQNRQINPDLDPEAREDVFSNPQILNNFLMMTVSPLKNPVQNAVEIYKKHKEQDDSVLSKISYPELINYSRILRDIKDSSVQLHLNIVQAIMKNIFFDHSTLRQLDSSGETIRREAVYQFSFQILEIFERHGTIKERKQGIELLKSFLSASEIDTGSKLVVINSFANTERTGGTDINWRLNKVFDEMKELDKGLIHCLQSVFDEYDARYLEGDRIIYDSEENFFFVLFQTWSGDASNNKEIEKIRKCALRALDQDLERIKLHLDQYDYENGWNTNNLSSLIDNFKIRFDRFQGSNIYMPLDLLLKVVKKMNSHDEDLNEKINFWSSIKNNSEVRKALEPKDDAKTLRAVLTRKKFLSNK